MSYTPSSFTSEDVCLLNFEFKTGYLGLTSLSQILFPNFGDSFMMSGQ